MGYTSEPAQATYLYDTGADENTVVENGGDPIQMVMPGGDFDIGYKPHDVTLTLSSATIAIDPEAGLTMDGDKAVVTLRGAWAEEGTFTKLLSSIKINDGTVPADIDTVTLSLGSAADFSFPDSVVPVELDDDTFGQINVLQSGIVELTVSLIENPSKTVSIVFVVPGDCNRNGSVESEDASSMIESAFTTTSDALAYAQKLMDMDKSGIVDSEDSSRALEIAFGIISYKAG